MTDTIAIRNNAISKLATEQLDFILLDGSGSMTDKWWEMLAALDTYVATLKSQNIESHLMLVEFDSNDKHLPVRDCHINDWKPFSEEAIGAHWGMTPLMDAIFLMGAKLRDLNPAKCAITIVTDGDDSGPGHNTIADIHKARAVLDWCRAHGWTVTFIGCNFDNDRQARALGANASNSIGVRKELLIEAAKSYGQKRAANARSGSDISFTDDEKQKFGGYLSHRPKGA